MTRAAIYARVSRPDESGAYVGPEGERGDPILENQVADLVAYCAARNLELPETNKFVEIASGGGGERVVFNQLMHLASLQRGRPFDIVVFSSLSRMTRGGIEAALYTLHVLEASGVGWHFVDQPTLNFDANTPPLAKDIILGVLAAVDRDYRRNISAKTKASFTKRKALAEANGLKLRWGRPPNCDCGHPRGKRGQRVHNPGCSMCSCQGYVPKSPPTPNAPEMGTKLANAQIGAISGGDP